MSRPRWDYLLSELAGMAGSDEAARLANAIEHEVTAALREAGRMREAIQGVLSDDDASTSLADQRARWPERMAALKRAIGE